MSPTLEEELKIIREGAEELLVLSELKLKLKRARTQKTPLTVKFGVDPTAPDLHLGHTVPLRKLRQFQELGHQVALLIGDFTARIGDPSERSEVRPELSSDEIKRNAKTYTEQAFKLLDKKRTLIFYNSRWFFKMSLEDLLKLASRFTVARLLERDDFSLRYSQKKPLFLSEFLYPVMQAYDSYVLKADLEVGGTDQKFNMLAGRELQKAKGEEPQIVITLPLLEGTDGKLKMSKSLGNHIDLLDPPQEMFGKVMSVPDTLLVKYFRLTTLLKNTDIDQIARDLKKEKLHPAEVKRRLAREITTLYWGKNQGKLAEEEFNLVFKEKGVPATIPKKFISIKDKGGKIWIIELLKKAGLVETNSQGRRLIAQKGVRLNRKLIASADLDVKIKRGDLVQVGKRKFVKVFPRIYR